MHYRGSLGTEPPGQVRSQKFAMRRGLFRRCEAKLIQFTLGIETVLCPKLGEDQNKKRPSRPYSLQVQTQSSHILIANANGVGAIFAFSAKIDLKSTKNRVFYILCMPMGGLQPSRIP